jgi:hypothetical protein
VGLKYRQEGPGDYLLDAAAQGFDEILDALAAV